MNRSSKDDFSKVSESEDCMIGAVSIRWDDCDAPSFIDCKYVHKMHQSNADSAIIPRLIFVINIANDSEDSNQPPNWIFGIKYNCYCINTKLG